MRLAWIAPLYSMLKIVMAAARFTTAMKCWIYWKRCNKTAANTGQTERKKGNYEQLETG